MTSPAATPGPPVASTGTVTAAAPGPPVVVMGTATAADPGTPSAATVTATAAAGSSPSSAAAANLAASTGKLPDSAKTLATSTAAVLPDHETVTLGTAAAPGSPVGARCTAAASAPFASTGKLPDPSPKTLVNSTVHETVTLGATAAPGSATGTAAAASAPSALTEKLPDPAPKSLATSAAALRDHEMVTLGATAALGSPVGATGTAAASAPSASTGKLTQHARETLATPTAALPEHATVTLGVTAPQVSPVAATSTATASAPSASAGKLPNSANTFKQTFDMAKANDFISQKNWLGLDDYLCSFLAEILEKHPNDVAELHPGLLFVPREKIVLELLHNRDFDRAAEFSEKYLRPLKECKTKFKPLDLELAINDLITYITKRLVPLPATGTRKRKGTDNGPLHVVTTETSLSDYMLLYFPSAMGDQRESQHQEDTWQFAVKLPVPDTRVSVEGKVLKPRHCFRCLACGWTSTGTLSITSMRYHLVHLEGANCRVCPKVTQDILDRLRAIGESKDVPDMVSLVSRFKSKRRKSSSSAANDGLSLSKSVSTSQSEPSTPPTIKAASALDTDPLLLKFDTLQSISSFLHTQVRALMPAPARSKCIEALRDQDKLLHDLRSEYLNMTVSVLASTSGPSNASSIGTTSVRGGASTGDLNADNEQPLQQ